MTGDEHVRRLERPWRRYRGLFAGSAVGWSLAAGPFDLVDGPWAVPVRGSTRSTTPTRAEGGTHIERDIGANKPAAALDRLHTYCMKKFAHLLVERGIAWNRGDPLQSRVSKYVKALEAERDIREIAQRIIKSAISVFDQFNDVRNNRSFAHDNDLIDQAEARFIFDAISAFLRFLKAIETARFGS